MRSIQQKDIKLESYLLSFTCFCFIVYFIYIPTNKIPLGESQSPHGDHYAFIQYKEDYDGSYKMIVACSTWNAKPQDLYEATLELTDKPNHKNYELHWLTNDILEVNIMTDDTLVQAIRINYHTGKVTEIQGE